MTDGGWYECLNSMIGTIFGVYTTSNHLNFMEVISFSLEAIQMKASLVSFLGTNNSILTASNAIQKQVVLKADNLARGKCVSI